MSVYVAPPDTDEAALSGNIGWLRAHGATPGLGLRLLEPGSRRFRPVMRPCWAPLQALRTFNFEEGTIPVLS